MLATVVSFVYMTGFSYTSSGAVFGGFLVCFGAMLAGYKLPRGVDFADEIPRSDAGKLRRMCTDDRHPIPGLQSRPPQRPHGLIGRPIDVRKRPIPAL
jgi:hypothetical protein